jgi:hypothetical protein
MGIFTEIGNNFESAIGSFVSSTASNVIDLIAPWVLISVTIYFLITGRDEPCPTQASHLLAWPMSCK